MGALGRAVEGEVEERVGARAVRHQVQEALALELLVLVEQEGHPRCAVCLVLLAGQCVLSKQWPINTQAPGFTPCPAWPLVLRPAFK